MTHHLDLGQLLWTAEQVPGDPQADDLGVLIAGSARTRARAFNHEVYGSIPLKAAALMQTLALLAPLERGNKAFSFAAARAFMRANGLPIQPPPDELRKVLASIAPGAQGVRVLAKHLDRWALEQQ
ncbi:fic family toxin-antitoxin system, toxin component [Streptomyces albidochromogenes]|uniref:Fic family toxin-antitoxin system, toxin component n=1 Tax=Streptomyces albidochromogenes TaxID=329524 RepID=A0ABW6FSK9_9ACTN